MLSHIRALHLEQRNVLRTGRLSVGCMAGEVLGVLDLDGQVRLCELLDPVGSVRDYGYDFMSAWRSAAAEAQRAKIRTRECSCTHCVNLSHSAPFSFLTELRRILDQRRIEREIVKRAAPASS